MREFREWGHKLADWVADYVESPEQHAVLASIRPNDIIQALPAGGPVQGEPMERIFSDFEKIILPGVTHWNHPNFLAYFANTSAPPAILAEFLAAALNTNGILWKTSPAVTELEVVCVRWLLAWMGLPGDWFGILFDTASISTLHALAAARVYVAPQTRDEGAPNNLIVYCSDQAHSSVEKGAMALGFGRKQVRRIPCDPVDFRLRPADLQAAIDADRAAGLLPCCVVATVGSTSTTSVDPVPAIAEIAEREHIWLHVDAAYAGSAAVAPEFHWLMEGCERAHSMVFNPHKWMMVPVDCSVLFSSRPDILRQAFSLLPEYLKTSDDGLNLMDYGIPLGRRFRALKLWFTMRYYGRDGIAAMIRDQVAMLQELRAKMEADSRFEICAPSPLSVVCFRLQGEDGPNRELLERINADGRFFLSHTVLNGRFVLRVAVGNLLTTRETLAGLWDLVCGLVLSI